MKKMIDLLKDNDLSLSMFLLFVVSLAGDSVSGLHSYNSQQASQGFSQLGYWQYLGSGAFLDGIFVNWQAAILQLTVLIIFSEFLVQRGASHSRRPEDEPAHTREKRSAAASYRRRGSRASQRQQPLQRWQTTWLYRNSLSLAFILLFAAAFSLHIVFGAKTFNEERALLHQPPIGIAAYLVSAKLWNDTFACWEAEFFVMWFFLVATIYLRQEYSAESKRLEAAASETGEPYE